MLLYSAFDGNSIIMYDDQARALGIVKNTREGGCKISANQVNSSTWNPSAGDLDMLSYLYDGKCQTLLSSFAGPFM
ncbi:hypothetical protein [Microbulbifer sp. VVAC002]|uniref:hypothetical protein n=1 Tax=Microbulbifer sp. VVAC002 TaxID=3243387 RepID=UPI00403A100D